MIRVFHKVGKVAKIGVETRATKVEKNLVKIEFRVVEVAARVMIAYLYVVQAHLKVESFDAVITSTIFICYHMASILFDSGFTFLMCLWNFI